jgi:hypothetical protein
MMQTARFLGLTALLLWTLSCTTAPPAPEVAAPLDDVWLSDIRSKIEEDRLAEAYQDISLLEREPVAGVEPGKIGELEEEVAGRLEAEFENSVEAREFERALRLFWALKRRSCTRCAPGRREQRMRRFCRCCCGCPASWATGRFSRRRGRRCAS